MSTTVTSRPVMPSAARTWPGGGGALADAGGDTEAAERGTGDRQAGRGGDQVGLDGADAVEVAGAVLRERSDPAAHAHLGRVAVQRHRVAQVGEHERP